MTPPPLPPHERAWRHPSELPPPRHEPPTRGGRVLIVATAAIGLAMVGVLAMQMTPARSPSRDAFVTVTSSSGLTGLSAGSLGEIAGTASSTGRRFTDLVGRTLNSLLASTDRGATPTVLRPAFAVVTPIGSDGLGLTTEAAIRGRTGTIDAMLPSGDLVTAEVVSASDGVAIVELAQQDIDTDTAPLSGLSSADDDLTVVAFGDRFSVGDDLQDLESLSVPEAAPVFDDEGNLVGLCTIGPDGVNVVSVGSLPDVEPLPTAPESSAIATEPQDTTAPAVGTRPVKPPASTVPETSSVTASTTASTEVVETESSVAVTSEPANSTVPETTG